MRLICLWCAILAVACGQDGYYAPQTFKQNQVERQALFQPVHRPWNIEQNKVNPYVKGLFSPVGVNDVTPQGTDSGQWRRDQDWRGSPGPLYTKSEPWRPISYMTKEQQAAILHHKQSLTSEGNFRFEYASDNGLAAGEVIEPDGTRVGAYQYKDPSGQLVKLKYRAGKDGFQILEGSHVPKSPEPVPPASTNQHYQQAYEQQRRQYELQQQYNQQRSQPETRQWAGNQVYEGQNAGGQFRQTWSATNWRDGQGKDDDGQYRENDIEEQNKGPHSFGEGYAFDFQG